MHQSLFFDIQLWELSAVTIWNDADLQLHIPTQAGFQVWRSSCYAVFKFLGSRKSGVNHRVTAKEQAEGLMPLLQWVVDQIRIVLTPIWQTRDLDDQDTALCSFQHRCRQRASNTQLRPNRRPLAVRQVPR
jgi:hypothetical protein